MYKCPCIYATAPSSLYFVVSVVRATFLATIQNDNHMHEHEQQAVSISTHTPKKGEANSERHNRQNQTIAILVVAFDLSCCLFVCVDVSSKSKAMQTERFYKMTSYFPFKSDFVHRCNAHCSVQRDKSFVFCTLCMWHSMFMFRVWHEKLRNHELNIELHEKLYLISSGFVYSSQITAQPSPRFSKKNINIKFMTIWSTSSFGGRIFNSVHIKYRSSLSLSGWMNLYIYLCFVDVPFSLSLISFLFVSRCCWPFPTLCSVFWAQKKKKKKTSVIVRNTQDTGQYHAHSEYKIHKQTKKIPKCGKQKQICPKLK